tara:strand:+ start:65675 stop:66154 length:480 start_codon:yes stop_codon:yes gene_type:complete
MRRVGSDDLEAFYKVYSDQDAMRWVGDGQPIRHDQCVVWIAVTQQNYQKRGYGMFAVELKSTGDVIGFCGLVHPDDQEEAEIKYALHRSQWGNGYASEMAGAVLRFGFDMLGLESVIATIAPKNSASIRIVEKLGMSRIEDRQEDDGEVTLVYSTNPGS